MQIVHMQPLVTSLSASDRLVQPLRKDSSRFAWCVLIFVSRKEIRSYCTSLTRCADNPAMWHYWQRHVTHFLLSVPSCWGLIHFHINDSFLVAHKVVEVHTDVF